MANSPVSTRLGKKLLVPLAAGLLLALAWYLWRHDSAAPPTVRETVAPGASPRHIYYGPRNSVAVRPFADRSASGEQAAQALGFANAVLDRLLGRSGLQVTAPTSSFFFRDPAVPSRSVAERLQSAFVVSGEWRAEGDAVTVTAVLYDAYRDRELWRESFQGDLAAVLALRDAVVDGLLSGLPAAGPLTAPPPREPAPAAWWLLQEARYRADPLGPPDLAAAERSYLAALEAQPDFDSARLGLAELWLHPGWPAAVDGAAVEGARAIAEQVLERGDGAGCSGPGQNAARAAGLLSHIRHRYDWRWQAAAEAAGQAVDRCPGDAGLLALASLARFTLGDLEQALGLLEASVQRDPLNLGSRLRLGLVQEFSGRYDEALATYRQLLTLRPEYPAAHAYRARVKVLQGKAESALRESGLETEPFWRRYSEALALFAAERDDAAQPLLQDLIAQDGAAAAFQLGEIFAYRRQTDAAFEWLDRARLQRDPGLSALLGNPLLENLHRDPRWPALLRTLELPLDWNE